MLITRFSLSAPLTFTTLQRLLPEFAKAASVRFVSEPPAVFLCSPSPDGDLRDRVADALAQLGVLWQWQLLTDSAVDAEPLFYQQYEAVLTLILPPGAEIPTELAVTLAQWNLEPRAVRRLSSVAGGQELALELYLDDWDRCQGLRAELTDLAARWEVDLTLTPSDSKRPRRRLIAFDMDSTLIQCEVIDELARRAGVGDEVAEVTARAMRGELDFRSSFRERMSKLRGLDAGQIKEVGSTLPLMPGARSLLRTLRAQGHHTVILSGGFDYFARQLQETLGVHEVHANTLEIIGEKLTGEVQGEIVDAQRKVMLLTRIAEREGFTMADTVAVGDGANDVPMLAAAGLGVAFHAKPLVRKTAPSAINYASLEALLYVLGVPAAD